MAWVRQPNRCLACGWYPFRVAGGREKDNRFGRAIEVELRVESGPYQGWKLVFVSDAVATPRNKSGRLLSALGFDLDGGAPIELADIKGRRVMGRVENYVSHGRTRAKVVEWQRRLERDLYDGSQDHGD